MPRVLIVEDERLLAFMLEDLLTDAGYEVMHAADLGEAARLVERTPPEVAVLDVRLNGALVFPLARELRGRNIPFLFASSVYRVEIPADLARQPLVSKPYAADEVIAALQALLRTPAAAAAWANRRTGEHPAL